ncbi:hypothetical protein DP116_07675 [Brasilonema bromeliae SPC951]|uniref:Uncharacterized protein n=1 Tax=Brasilonema bromeliae SPC951 TaxID=385972 RepID=A0ABX1P669_9CYAN|nr:hypothetical protein [Brasilonema bromeliae SPC951]
MNKFYIKKPSCFKKLGFFFGVKLLSRYDNFEKFLLDINTNITAIVVTSKALYYLVRSHKSIFVRKMETSGCRYFIFVSSPFKSRKPAIFWQEKVFLLNFEEIIINM